MRIDTNKIPPEGLSLEENIAAGSLDLETEIIKFRKPINVRADVYKITNTVTVEMALVSLIYTNCSRCLDEIDIVLDKKVRLSFRINQLEPVVDLNEGIREEIILEYPIKPLCKADCQGLCPRCGKNLNEGRCSC